MDRDGENYEKPDPARSGDGPNEGWFVLRFPAIPPGMRRGAGDWGSLPPAAFGPAPVSDPR